MAEGQAITAAAVAAQLDALPATTSADLIANGQKLLDELTAGALANSEKAVSLNPHHTNLYKSKAKVELYLATIEPRYNQQALKTLEQLASLSPTDAKVVYNLGVIYDQLGDSAKAQTAFRKAVGLKPDYEAARALIK